jgi:hypothetical protein
VVVVGECGGRGGGNGIAERTHWGRTRRLDIEGHTREGGSGDDDGRGCSVGRKNEAAGSCYLEKISFLLCYIGGNLY